jgi:hypothetical protein
MGRPSRRVIVLAAVVWGCGDVEPTSSATSDATQRPRVGPPAARVAWFAEEARRRGIEFTYRHAREQRYDFPEIVGGGAALLDYDGDGWLDVYLVQGGDLREPGPDLPRDVLYRNRGDGTFEDVTSAAGIDERGYGMGCACGDYDADGDVDLYVTNCGPNVLYRNEGNGTFRDVTQAAGVACQRWSASAAWADLDADGFLDLFVTNYIDWAPEREASCGWDAEHRDYCHPNAYQAPAAPNLYRNRGDGTFEDISISSGVSASHGNGLGVACADFDDDGRIDVYLANDMQENDLWLNQGVVDGELRFVNKSLIAGCALDGMGELEAGMGVQAFPWGPAGLPALFVTNMQGQSNSFYSNRGGTFEDVTARQGLSSVSLPMTGFGVGFQDFDNDGNLDLYAANGGVRRPERSQSASTGDPYAMVDTLCRSNDSGQFVELAPRGGTEPELVATSRGAAFGDFDNDGGVDVVVVNRADSVHVLRNVVPDRGHWLLLRVLDARGVDAIQARVELAAGGRVQWRRVDPSYSYCASNDPRVHFGLGNATRADEVTVHWPDGTQERFGPLEADRIVALQRGKGRQ